MAASKTLSVKKEKAATKKTGGAKLGDLQGVFLNYLRKEKAQVTIFLVKGVKLQGVIVWFDNFSVLLRRDGQSQLIYKHAISTIVPGLPMDARQFALLMPNNTQKRLQDVFLSRVAEHDVQVMMYLSNGVVLQGGIAAFDQFCVFLERDGYIQLTFKHAVATIQPTEFVDLSEDTDEDDY